MHTLPLPSLFCLFIPYSTDVYVDETQHVQAKEFIKRPFSHWALPIHPSACAYWCNRRRKKK